MRFLILAMMALLIPLGGCKENWLTGNDEITLEYLQERYGQHGIPFDASLIDLYNQTHDKCPKDIHIAYTKDHELPSGEMLKDFRAWRPAYLGLENIYVNVQQPFVYEKVTWQEPNNYIPFTNDKWLEMGRDEAEYQIITPEFLKDKIKTFIMSELAYCSVKNGEEPKSDLIQFVDTPFHDAVGNKNVLTLVIRAEEQIGANETTLISRRYRPEWNNIITHEVCNSSKKEFCESVKNEPYFYLSPEIKTTLQSRVNSITTKRGIRASEFLIQRTQLFKPHLDNQIINAIK